MKPPQSSPEELSQSESLSPSPVVCITDDKSRKQEKEIHGKIPVIEPPYDPVATSADAPGKGIPLKNMVKHHHQRRRTPKRVQSEIMRLAPRKTLVHKNPIGIMPVTK